MTFTASTGRVHGGRRRRAAWRLDPSGRHPRRSPQSGRPEAEGSELCLALLDEAIARAEHSLACRERALAEYDRRHPLVTLVGAGGKPSH
jgi:hypothetical protein